uniref:Poly(ADP-ribose) polymerase family member 12 n=1 Tax=Ornithorhynchus anatinus TaxID=9258 RepID=A0A6I8NH23_ORNAN
MARRVPVPVPVPEAGRVSAARLCLSWGGPAPGCAGRCGQLHLCRYFLFGTCRQAKAGKACKFGHSFRSAHNATVLLHHRIQNLSDIQLRLLLLQNDPSLLPEVCLHYNKGDGPHGACTFKKTCGKLHVCQFYLRGTCRFGQGCKRSHDLLSSENLEKLEKWGMSADLTDALPAIYRNAYAIQLRGQSPSSGPDRPSDRSMGSGVRLDHKCFRVHFHLPYRWQFQDGTTWKDFETMEAIEKAYCDPGKNRLLVSGPVGRVASLNFEDMSWDSTRARRLSTTSSLTKPPHFILTTDWLWFWEDELGQWREYGMEGPKRSTASISSQDLEKAYLDGTAPTLQFKAGNHTYEFDFKAMVQKNLYYGTKRKVCRRPRFISEGDVVKKQKSDPRGQRPQNIPAHWDRSALPDPGYKLIPLDASSEEYQKVQGLFQRTVPKLYIWSIQRIQNVALWQVFQWELLCQGRVLLPPLQQPGAELPDHVPGPRSGGRVHPGERFLPPPSTPARDLRWLLPQLRGQTRQPVHLRRLREAPGLPGIPDPVLGLPSLSGLHLTPPCARPVTPRGMGPPGRHPPPLGRGRAVWEEPSPPSSVVLVKSIGGLYRALCAQHRPERLEEYVCRKSW